jgi:hypothetical protein
LTVASPALPVSEKKSRPDRWKATAESSRRANLNAPLAVAAAFSATSSVFSA